MDIRLAAEADLPEILRIYAAARRFMAANGNPTQWPADYLTADMLRGDIARRQLYVCCGADGAPCGVFALIFGADPSYAHIEQGSWRSDAPYATIHRLAADGTQRGVAAAVVAYCARQHPVLRADTHANNLPMRHLLQKLGFLYCGIIYVADGTPRLAYQRG